VYDDNSLLQRYNVTLKQGDINNRRILELVDRIEYWQNETNIPLIDALSAKLTLWTHKFTQISNGLLAQNALLKDADLELGTWAERLDEGYEVLLSIDNELQSLYNELPNTGMWRMINARVERRPGQCAIEVDAFMEAYHSLLLDKDENAKQCHDIKPLYDYTVEDHLLHERMWQMIRARVKAMEDEDDNNDE